jgi:hypothetical protein
LPITVLKKELMLPTCLSWTSGILNYELINCH